MKIFLRLLGAQEEMEQAHESTEEIPNSWEDVAALLRMPQDQGTSHAALQTCKHAGVQEGPI